MRTRHTATPAWPAPRPSTRGVGRADLADARRRPRRRRRRAPGRRRHLRRDRRLRPPRPRAHPRGDLPRGRRAAQPPALYAVLTPCRGPSRTARGWPSTCRPTGASSSPGGRPFFPSVVPDEVVTHRVVDPAVVEVQTRALRHHETQVVVGEGWSPVQPRRGPARRAGGLRPPRRRDGPTRERGEQRERRAARPGTVPAGDGPPRRRRDASSPPSPTATTTR